MVFKELWGLLKVLSERYQSFQESTSLCIPLHHIPGGEEEKITTTMLFSWRVPSKCDEA
jgi:hypothetical protein